MSIYSIPNDTWDNQIGNKYGGLYFYAMNNDLREINNDCIMSFAPCIQSIVFNPFFDINEFNLNKIPFDKSYFGSPNNNNVNVFRIIPYNTYTITTLANVSFFYNKPNNNYFNEDNESKLQMSPYTYYEICDYFNTPLRVELQGLYDLRGKTDIKVMYTLSNKGSYNLYVDGYKQDFYGNVHGMLNTSSLDIPVLSSAYSQFLATSKNSFKTGVDNEIKMNNVYKSNNQTQYQLSLINTLASTFQGNFVGALTGGINGGANYQMQNNLLNATGQQIISSSLAQVQDLESSPRAVVSVGSDALFSISNGRFRVDLIKYGLSGDGRRRIGSYFALYGYKQNKFMKPNLRSRYYYNYIKTLDANIIADMPKEHLSKLKDIFNRGVTIWHIDRDNVKMFEYYYDNKEVY